MLTNFPPVLRLTIFLLLSLGLHGGLAFYDWMSDPAESGVVAAPVLVSFLPATELQQNISKTELQQVQPPPPPPEPPRATVETQVSPPVRKTKTTSFKKPVAAEEFERVAVDSPVPEMVCLTPQEVAVENCSAQLVTEAAPVAENVALASLARSAIPPLAEVASGAVALVEAIPHYRSNPLPEYPRLARRKHWQGVVWLLVDVSPTGLVEDLQVEESCGHRVLDRAAERTVKRWRFSPATRGGLPVSSQVRIPVRFRLEES